MMNSGSDETSKEEHGTQSPDDLWYPSLIIPLTSPLGQQFLSSSSHLAYDRLLSCFEPQERSDFCGVASAAILLNTLQPYHKWNQSTLYATVAQGLMSKGMSLAQLSYVLEVCGVLSTIRYCKGEGIEDQFQKDIKEQENLVIMNYWRQYEEDEKHHVRRGGHFSPLGGFHEMTDRVLIMDTYQPKFSHHWLDVKSLVRMMRAKDGMENAPRGYLIIVDEAQK
jgi:glutathione gamma-glutamylcysteinyltransferase